MIPPTELLQRSREIGQNVLARWAAEVDECGRFPTESVAALHEGGLIGFFVPARLGGLEGDTRTFWQIAAILGESCLSTALIWAMHGQQVATLAEHAAEEHAGILADVARRGSLVASVTTEYGKGGDLFTSRTPLRAEPGGLRLCRAAPIVSYGAEAEFYLITMLRGEGMPANDVCLALVKRTDGQISVAGEWQAMGMRGTASVPMSFDVHIGPERLIGRAFRQMALQTMVPIGHLGWAAAWFGAARGACRRFVGQLRRSSQGRQKLKSDLFIHRLASIRVSLDLMESMIYRLADQLEQWKRDDAPPAMYEDITFNITLNNLKIASSQLAFAVSDGLLELSGLSQGYLKGDALGLERTFRDLRSAALMYHNDRLMAANGKLILVEHSSMQGVWQ